MIGLALRTMPVFAVIIGLAMALAAYLNFTGVRTAYLDLIRSRMAMSAESIGNNIAIAHGLGIRLSEQVTLPALLGRQAAADPLLKSIDVVSEEGAILFSSDAVRVGTADAAALDAGAFRHQQHIVNDFGAPVGTVVVRLDGVVIDSRIDELRLAVLAGSVPAGIGAVIGGCLICLLLLTRLHRRAEASVKGRAADDALGRAASELDRLGAQA
jgi:hypothetical protein